MISHIDKYIGFCPSPSKDSRFTTWKVYAKYIKKYLKKFDIELPNYIIEESVL
jgi:hypothetical protein